MDVIGSEERPLRWDGAPRVHATDAHLRCVEVNFGQITLDHLRCVLLHLVLPRQMVCESVKWSAASPMLDTLAVCNSKVASEGPYGNWQRQRPIYA